MTTTTMKSLMGRAARAPELVRVSNPGESTLVTDVGALVRAIRRESPEEQDRVLGQLAEARAAGYREGWADGVAEQSPLAREILRVAGAVRTDADQRLFTAAMGGLAAERRTALEGDLSRNQHRVRAEVRSRDALEDLRRWASLPPVLERPGGPVTGSLLAALERGNFTTVGRPGAQPRAGRWDREADDFLRGVLSGPRHVLVVEHDWSAALAGARDYGGGDYRTPYNPCFFEFKVSGRRAVVLSWYDESGADPRVRHLPAVDTRGGWVICREVADAADPGDPPAIGVMVDQVRAACVALEAGAAEAEPPPREPHLRNSRRPGRQPLPELDVRVVRLSRRRGPAPLPGADRDPDRRRPRLHFVRGHWRRYAAHRTWIRWHLRGDPDLGFIDKHYRL